MNRCRRIEYFTTNSTQSITDGLGAVKERQKWITKAGYELEVGMLGTAKQRKKRITKARYELVLEDQVYFNTILLP
ncbi:hypothetical protein GBAR_LOCUS18832 [Geodia barretti]|uniref:Uncharacterized protein n=1 Tax=Geodia barretti TaxID=519541 RepID=A0AA35SP28_GEOBA|nr:hypothetical protein GBAR_LOCUS18832 [Geodia barretti]